MKKYKIKQKLKIKGENVPVFIEGEDAGVIATQVIEIDDLESPLEMMGALEAQQKLIDRNIEVDEEFLGITGEEE